MQDTRKHPTSSSLSVSEDCSDSSGKYTFDLDDWESYIDLD